MVFRTRDYQIVSVPDSEQNELAGQKVAVTFVGDVKPFKKMLSATINTNDEKYRC
jgi:hypothetical protein